MDAFQVYKDMKARTNGEIYIGVVGPVRTGKSTFIKRFMDLLVLPNMTDEHAKERTKDELPQSASGTTIMTTEPKFVPKDAASVRLSEDVEVKIRLIDCVGYMVDGASGHIENDVERQVKTPWFEHEIPFTKAAAIGTQKVIHDHATIGLVITTDGSIGELREKNLYFWAEEKDHSGIEIHRKAVSDPFEHTEAIQRRNKKSSGENGGKSTEYLFLRSTVRSFGQKILIRSCGRCCMSFQFQKQNFIFRSGWKCCQRITR